MLENCIQIKLNDSKTELLIIVTNQQLSKIDVENTFIEIGNSRIKPSKNVKNLCIIFDQTLSFNSHIKSLNQKSYYQRIRLQQLKNCIDRPTLESIIH